MSLPLAVRRCYRALSVLAEQEFGVSDGRLAVFRAVSEAGSATQAALARATLLDPAAITRHLRAMEDDGHVRRETSSHHASVRVVTLTTRGAAWFEAARRKREALETALETGFDPADVAVARRILLAVADRADELLQQARAAEAA